jgi:hypothetical protein
MDVTATPRRVYIASDRLLNTRELDDAAKMHWYPPHLRAADMRVSLLVHAEEQAWHGQVHRVWTRYHCRRLAE